MVPFMSTHLQVNTSSAIELFDWNKTECILFGLHHFALQVMSCYFRIPTYLLPQSPSLEVFFFSRTFPYLVTIIALCGHSLLLIPILSPFKCSHGGLFTFALVGNFKEVRFLNPFLIEFRIGTYKISFFLEHSLIL